MSKSSTTLSALAKSFLAVLFFAISLFILVPPVLSHESETYSFLPRILLSAGALFGYLSLRKNFLKLTRAFVITIIFCELLVFVLFGYLIYYRLQMQ